MRLLFFIFIILATKYCPAQDTLKLKPVSSLILLKEIPKQTTHSTPGSMTLPKHIQGKFCDFEDQIQRKKIPLNFSLGEGKY